MNVLSRAYVGVWAVAALLSAAGCARKISESQCDELRDRYATLATSERFGDAGAEVLTRERTREREDVRSADEFKSCTSEVQLREYDCARQATTSQAMLKCLE